MSPKLTTKDLLPPPPDGLSIDAPQMHTLADLNLRSFFETGKGNSIIALRPEVIAVFPQLLPIMEWVAQSIKIILEKQHEAMTSGDEGAQAELARFTHELVSTLNERISGAVTAIVFKKQYADKPNLLLLLEGGAFPNEDQIREIARKAITSAVEMKLIVSKRAIAKTFDINSGQFSNFIRNAGPLGMDKVVECLNYVATEAVKTGRLDELKSFVFNG